MMRVSPSSFRRQAHPPKYGKHLGLARLRVQFRPIAPQRFRQQGFNAQARVERGKGILKHHLNTACRVGAAHLFTHQTHRATVRLLQPHGQPRQRAFPTARFAYNPQNLARIDL